MAPDALAALADLPHVRSLDDLDTWDDELVGPVVVLGGGKAGLTLARRARSLGHAVTVVEPSAVLAVELGLPGRFRWIADLEAAGRQVHLIGGADVAAELDAKRALPRRRPPARAGR